MLSSRAKGRCGVWGRMSNAPRRGSVGGCRGGGKGSDCVVDVVQTRIFWDVVGRQELCCASPRARRNACICQGPVCLGLFWVVDADAVDGHGRVFYLGGSWRIWSQLVKFLDQVRCSDPFCIFPAVMGLGVSLPTYLVLKLLSIITCC